MFPLPSDQNEHHYSQSRSCFGLHVSEEGKDLDPSPPHTPSHSLSQSSASISPSSASSSLTPTDFTSSFTAPINSPFTPLPACKFKLHNSSVFMCVPCYRSSCIIVIYVSVCHFQRKVYNPTMSELFG